MKRNRPRGTQGGEDGKHREGEAGRFGNTVVLLVLLFGVGISFFVCVRLVKTMEMKAPI